MRGAEKAISEAYSCTVRKSQRLRNEADGAYFPLGLEREAEVAEKCFRLFLTFRSCHDGDGKTEDIFRVFVGGLREGYVLFESY